LVKTEKMYDVGNTNIKNGAILKNMPTFRTLLDNAINNTTTPMNVTNSTLLVTNNTDTWGLGIGDWAPIPNPQSPIPKKNKKIF
jgi:hypothetical protein